MTARGTGHGTMRDVAEACGVSVATVSRVLRGQSGQASVATTERIHQAASELGYVIDGRAASLRVNRTNLVALLIADVTNPFFAEIALSLETVLRAADISLLIANTDNSLEAERWYTTVMTRNRVDGLVVAPSGTTSKHLKEARDRGTEIVLIDSALEGLDVPSVTVDNEAASRQATEFLLDEGHQRIAFVHGGLANHTDQVRFASYCAALEDRGLLPMAFDGHLTVTGGAACAEAILAANVTAVLVANNMMTIGLRKELARRSVHVPGWLSLLGFDDMDWYELADPGISAIAQPTHDMGRLAGEILIRRLQGAARIPRPVLGTALRMRGSTARPG